MSLTRTSNRKSAKFTAVLTAAGTTVATAAVAAAALAIAGPAAGSLSGLGSAGPRAQVAHVATVTRQAAPGGPAVTPTLARTGAQLTVVIHYGGTARTARLGAAAGPAAGSAAQAARQTARNMLGHFGWGGRQFSPLDKLWDRESSWNKYAYNPSSGAYGIPQAVPGSKMASAGRHWRTSATTQIRWGLGYIKSRYGYPRRAWEHELAYGWY